MANPKQSQFMNIEQLKALKSNDFSTDQYSHSKVRDLTTISGGPERLNLKVGQLSKDHPFYQTAKPYDWDRLHEDVANEGLKEPLHVGVPHNMPADSEPRLMNGHHRAIEAISQGHMFVPVTDRPSIGGHAEYSRIAYKPPTRTWEPMIQQHENEAEANRVHAAHISEGQRQDFRQGQLFQNPGFNDRRTTTRKKGSFFDQPWTPNG